MANPQDLHVDRPLSTFAQLYTNEEYIWDKVMPVFNVAKLSDEWWVFNKGERFRKPDDKMGHKSIANEVEHGHSTSNYSVKPYGLQEFVSVAEVRNADMPLTPEQDAVDYVMELLLLSQEFRTAAVVNAVASYASGNTAAVGTIWTNKSSGDPIADIVSAMKTPFKRPNIMQLDIDSWDALRQHPKILDAVAPANRNQGAGGGLATRQAVAALFELREVVVGMGRINTAKKGQSDSFGRVWAKGKVSLLHVIQGTLTRRSNTFGCTIKEQLPTVRAVPAPLRGTRGGDVIVVAHNSDEKVKADDLGFLLTGAA